MGRNEVRRARTGGRRRLRNMAIGLVAMAAVASGCTVSQNKQYQVDYVVWGYHFHIYQIPTAQIWGWHKLFCHDDYLCTLYFVRDQVELNGIVDVVSGVGAFFDEEDRGDFRQALDSITPANPTVNEPLRFGCLGGYKNLTPNVDGDWYGSAANGDWCRPGEKVVQ